MKQLLNLCLLGAFAVAVLGCQPTKEKHPKRRGSRAMVSQVEQIAVEAEQKV